MKQISIIVVDDHKLVREMWAKMFEDIGWITVIGASGIFDEAIAMIREKRPDIVLLDISLPHASGLDAVPLIRKFSPDTRIIAVSMHNHPAYAKKMIQLGARAYITKNSSHQEMTEAIEEVMNNRIYICAEIKNNLAGQLITGTEPGDPATKSLSLREMEIIRLIKEGLSSKDIAASLHLSNRTVEVHRHNILKKLNLKNTAALINYINNEGLF